MFVTEKYMESFKESIFKRLERHENNFRNLVEKVKGIEVSQSEHKRRQNFQIQNEFSNPK